MKWCLPLHVEGRIVCVYILFVCVYFYVLVYVYVCSVYYCYQCLVK